MSEKARGTFVQITTEFECAMCKTVIVFSSAMPLALLFVRGKFVLHSH